MTSSTPPTPSSFALSPEQEAALDLSESTALSAGAGSGKTRVLAERYVRAVASEGFDLRTTLAVTYTEKAAGELRRRVGERLAALARGGDRAAETAVRRLDEAWIGTIHSACRRLLNSVGPERGRAAPSRVLDADEAKALLLDAVDRATDRAANGEGPPEIGAALERLLRVASRRSIVDALATYATRRTASRRFSVEAETRTFEAEREILDAAIRAERARAARLRARFIKRLAERGLDRPSALALARASNADFETEPPGRKGAKPVRLVEASRNLVAALSARDPGGVAGVIDEARDLLDAKAGKNVGEDVTRAFETLVDATRATLRGYERCDDAFEASEAPGGPLDVCTFELSKAAATLFRAADALYEDRLAADGATDFDGLLEGADALLSDPTFGAVVAERFRHVLVDEFQDTDPLQWRIASRFFGKDGVRRGGLFLVGDPKQAVYGFRGGDVSAYRRATEEAAAARNEAGVAVGAARVLRDNYRATPGLVAFVDALQSEIFPDRDDAEPYEAWREASVSARAKETCPPASSIDVLDVDAGTLPARERKFAEARAVAAHLKSLLGVATVFDDATRRLRPARPSDVAILLRKRDGVPAIEAALAAEGIPFRVLGGVGFHGRPEVATSLLSLAHAADPDDDATTLALLRSPLFCVSDAALLEAVAGPEGGPKPKGSLASKIAALSERAAGLSGAPSGLSEEDVAALVEAAKGLARVRSLAARAPLDEAARRVAADSSFAALLDAFDPSGRAAANVDLLIERLRRRSEGDEAPEAIVRSLLVAAEEDARAEQADPPDAREDAAIVATEHGAKGLEWPIVVLPFCGDDRARSDASRPPFRSVDDGAFLAAWPTTWTNDASEDSKDRATAARLSDRRARLEDAAERARLFYVAATRARDHLVFSSVGEKKVSERRAALSEIVPDSGATFGDGPGRAVARVVRARPTAARTPRVIDAGFLCGASLPTPSSPDREPPWTTLPAEGAHLLMTCPRRAYLEYALGAGGFDAAPKLRGARRGDAQAAVRDAETARVRGTILHAALDAAASGGDPASRARRTAFELGVDDASAGTFAAEALAAVSRFKASALGARVFASSARRLTEKEIVFDAPPIRFKGRPDLVAIDARGYVVVDYKTGGVSGPSGGEGLDPAYVAQAEVYAAAVFAATGAPTESSLFFVDDGRCATVVAASGGAAATVDRLREIARRAARAGAFFQKTSDAARCASCPHLVSGACDGAEGAAG